MATAKERRDARTRARQKERREAARTARKDKTVRARVRTTAAGKATDWPIAEAWLSQDWFERERVLTGAVVRAHSDGNAAVLLLQVDLASDGLTSAEIRSGITVPQARGLLAERTGDRPLGACEPAAVARLFEEGLAWRKDRGLPVLAQAAAAAAFLEGIEADLANEEFLFGTEDDDEPTEEVRKPGLLGRLFGLR